MLPNPALAEVYEDIVWLYVYTDFSRSEKDRAVERIMMRFGVSSWPQLFLVDPGSLDTLAETGRSVESFLSAVKRTKVKKSRSRDLVEATRAAEEHAIELEKTQSVKAARKALEEQDIVLRLTALRVLAKKDPKSVVERAEELLRVPNDPFRYEVCTVLGEARAAKAEPALDKLVVDPSPSRNPNVLRIHAVNALAECGTADSVEAIAVHAETGAYFNGLTRASVDALASIAKRDKKARRAVEAALHLSYPKPPDPSDERAMKACVALAKHVHEALGARSTFPDPYDEAAWRALRK